MAARGEIMKNRIMWFIVRFILFGLILILLGCANTKFYFCGIDVEKMEGANLGEMALGAVAAIAVHVGGHYLFAELNGVEIHQKGKWEVVGNYDGCSEKELAWFHRGGFLLQLAVNTVLIEFIDTPTSYFTEGFTLATTAQLLGYPFRFQEGGDINALNNVNANGDLEYGIALGWQLFNFMRISIKKEEVKS